MRQKMTETAVHHFTSRPQIYKKYILPQIVFVWWIIYK
jgi:hypothetical protein